MTKKLYLMRHGQTLFNKLDKIQGACDSPLTAKGISDAKEVGEFFKEQNFKFDKFYSSTQERASDTLELVTDQSYERLKGIKEWNFGIFEGESEALIPDTYFSQDSYGDVFVDYEGESFQAVKDRVTQTLTEIMKQADDGQSVFAVSHGAAILLFIQTMLPMAVIEEKVSLHNCAVLEFTFDDDVFKFDQQVR